MQKILAALKMSRQQLKKSQRCQYQIPAIAPMANPRPCPRPEPGFAIRFLSTLTPRPRTRPSTELLPIDLDEFEKMKWRKADQYQKILGMIG